MQNTTDALETLCTPCRKWSCARWMHAGELGMPFVKGANIRE
jgi:hypothetical protein